MDSEELERFILNEVFPIIQENLERFTTQLLEIQQLPPILTNENLKDIFQISDSTLNRLIKISGFPSYWYGIRGHYLREDVLAWMKENNCLEYREKMRQLRSL